METIQTPISAIEFMTSEKKQISLSVSEHFNLDDMFNYNAAKIDTETIVTDEDLDWDTFLFEFKMKIDFEYQSRHEKSTHDYPGYDEINFEVLDADITIEECSRWDEQNEEYVAYKISPSEKAEIVKYLKGNITLQS